MTKQTEAMKLALEALDHNSLFTSLMPGYDGRIIEKAYKAINKALAEQPAQDDPDLQDKDPELVEQPAQQEPVAWMYPDDYERMTTSETFCTVYSVEVGSATRGESTVALYTSPPAQRTWVGLTDEETGHWAADFLAGAKWAEAKLKEKNT